MTSADTPARRRVHFFDGMLLDAADLTTEQCYYETRLAVLAARLGTGVLEGLELPRPPTRSLDGTHVEVAVSPGVAIAADGRLLVVAEPLASDLPWRASDGEVRVLALHGAVADEVRQRPLVAVAAQDGHAAGDEAPVVVRYTEAVEARLHEAGDTPAEAVALAQVRARGDGPDQRFEVESLDNRLAFTTVDALARAVRARVGANEAGLDDCRRRLEVTETRLNDAARRAAGDGRELAALAQRVTSGFGASERALAAVRSRLDEAEAALAAARRRLRIERDTARALLRETGDGIVEGLDVAVADEAARRLQVAPGVAVDVAGRGLMLGDTCALTPETGLWRSSCVLGLAVAAPEVAEAAPSAIARRPVLEDELVLLLGPSEELPVAAVVLARWHAPDDAGRRIRDEAPDVRRLMPTAANLAHVAEVEWSREGSGWCVGVVFEAALCWAPDATAAAIAVERTHGEQRVLPARPSLATDEPARVNWRFSIHPDYLPAPGDLLRLRMNCAGLVDVRDLPVVAARRSPRRVPVTAGGVFETAYRVDGLPASKGSS
jgi:hypothetical protein